MAPTISTPHTIEPCGSYALSHSRFGNDESRASFEHSQRMCAHDRWCGRRLPNPNAKAVANLAAANGAPPVDYHTTVSPHSGLGAHPLEWELHADLPVASRSELILGPHLVYSTAAFAATMAAAIASL